MALVAMGGVLLIYAQAVTALGVGEPRYLSHLFEPLRVDVPVDTKGVDPAAVKVGVSFSGVDPAAAAEIESRLRREWRVDDRGNYVLRISTDQPIHEPLMQMRVEVGDDRIQAVRELTLLFDPAPVEAPQATLLAEVAPPVAVDQIATVEPIAIAAESEPTAATAAVEAISIAKVAPIAGSAAVSAPAAIAALPRAVVATAAPLASAPTITRPALIASPSLVKPLAAAPESLIVAAPAAVSIPAPTLKTTHEIDAQIASTHRAQALSGADRWQRLPVAAGDTLDSLAERARGDQTAIPLPMVSMLLRWLNPRSFYGIGNQPLVGAELRFPKPESLAAQIAISGGVWTVDDVTATSADAAKAVVPPPSFQVLNPQSASDMAAAMGIGTVLMAARPVAASSLPPALSGGRAAAGGLAASSGLVGGAVLAGLLSMVLMLNMVVTTPAPQASRYVAAAVVARSVSATASAAEARALPAESLDLAALDLASLRQAEAVRQRTES